MFLDCTGRTGDLSLGIANQYPPVALCCVNENTVRQMLNKMYSFYKETQAKGKLSIPCVPSVK